MTEPPLQPLRIPANWTISYNTFFEIEPSESVTEYSCEDLFQAKCDRTDVLVDLGWHPDGDSTERENLLHEGHRGRRRSWCAADAVDDLVDQLALAPLPVARQVDREYHERGGSVAELDPEIAERLNRVLTFLAVSGGAALLHRGRAGIVASVGDVDLPTAIAARYIPIAAPVNALVDRPARARRQR